MSFSIRRRSWLLSTIATGALALTGACTSSFHSPMTRATAGKPALGTWGVDLATFDRAVNPGDDFFRYVNGTWLEKTSIPADRIRWGVFDALAEKSVDDVRAAIEATASETPAAGTVGRKVVDYDRAYVDTATIDRRGIEPARADLARISAIATHEDFARVAYAPGFRAQVPVALNVSLDAKRPDAYILMVSQSGLGMPDREFYLKSDPRSLETRAQYLAYIERVLSLSGEAAADSATEAAAILALETRIAELHWPREKSRNRDLTYNPKTRATLAAMAPQFPWAAALEGFDAPKQDAFIVAQADAIEALATLFVATPIATLRPYLRFHFVNSLADVLPSDFDNASFEFNDRVLLGQASKRDRARRSITAMSGRTFQAPMGEAVGQLYVKREFRPEAKVAMAKLVENLREAYRVRIARLPWMTEETRRAAQRKLDTLRVKIGYPDRWRDYSTMEVRAGDAYGNRRREQAFNHRRDLARLSQAADRGEWAMTPHTINAYYNSLWNEVVFPAAVLQSPFFDADSDPAVNYGAIGAVIGHEMGHAFDDQGAKSDEHGILRSWWNARDEANFKALGDKLADQYSKFEALPGAFVNGRLTLGENIGDLGGLNVALEAYRMSLGGKEPPVLDGFGGTQRFFLGFGQVWRTKTRDETTRNRLVSDSHSPAEFRVNGTVRNMDEWYAAFAVKPSAKLYLEPNERVRVW